MKSFLLLTVMLVMSGCSFVGVKLSPDTPGLCKMSSMECRRENGDIAISYKIIQDNDEYEVAGKAVLKGFDRYLNASFTLFLLKDNTIVDEIPIMSGSGSGRIIEIRRKFKGKDFDSSIIQVSIEGVDLG